MLSESDIERLEGILFAPEHGERGFDVFGVHGAVTAAVIGPDPVSADTIFAVSTGRPTEESHSAPFAFTRIIENTANRLRQTLEQGNELDLPEPDDAADEEEATENWCAGFTDIFLLEEERWLQWDEALVGELMTPILTLSNLFDDQDFQQARQDPERFGDYVTAIPEALVDLYLHFHSP